MAYGSMGTTATMQRSNSGPISRPGACAATIPVTPGRARRNRIRDIEFGIYLTRWFARVDAQQKAMIEIRLAHARALLAAIDPGQAALPRSAVISLKGALALRRYPQVAERQWLTAFIARAERALRTRWRIGVF